MKLWLNKYSMPNKKKLLNLHNKKCSGNSCQTKADIHFMNFLFVLHEPLQLYFNPKRIATICFVNPHLS